jgi:transcriptional regulator with XRE-family HTH domain
VTDDVDGWCPQCARMRALTDVTGETFRQWRESQGWDVPRMARELRKAARDSGEEVAAHQGLVRMIARWERGGGVPRERYRLLYLKIFEGVLSTSRGIELGVDVAWRPAEAPARAARLPSSGQIMALEAAALGRPRQSQTPAQIRALAAEAFANLQEVACKLTELSALLADDEPGGAMP